MSAVGAPVRGPRFGAGYARRFARRGWAVKLSAIFLLLLPVVAVAAPLLAPYDPDSTDLGAVLAPPSIEHWLGTDSLGRDVLSRLIFATRTSLLGPLAVVLISSAIGVAIALLAAWKGGRADSAITAGLDVLLGFPALLIALLAVAVFGVGLVAPVVALTVAYIPYFARMVRGAAIRERSQEYVSALTVAGMSGPRITLRHIVPNILPLILTQAALMFAYAIVDLAAISYLGLGVQPPTPDWGNMVAVGQSGVLQNAPQEAIAAGAMIVLTVVALNVLSEAAGSRSGKDRV